MRKERYIKASDLLNVLRVAAENVVRVNGDIKSVDKVPFFLDEIDQYVDEIDGIILEVEK